MRPSPAHCCARQSMGRLFRYALLGFVLLYAVTFMLYVALRVVDQRATDPEQRRPVTNHAARPPEAKAEFAGVDIHVTSVSSLATVSLSQLRTSGWVQLSYAPFAYARPEFLDQRDRDMFVEGLSQDELVHARNASRGLIRLIPSGIFTSAIDCSQSSRMSDFWRQTWRADRGRYHKWIVVPLVVPNSHYFQHFIDGVIPKLMQAYSFILEDDDIRLLINVPKDRIIAQILDKLQIRSERLLYYHGGYIKSSTQLNTCVTPPHHPVLWQRARELLSSASIVPDELRTVVLVSRDHTGSRRMTNKPEIIQLLQVLYGDKLEHFARPTTLDDAIDKFGRARIIIGVHGGGLYNILFAPKDSAVVEIVPISQGQSSKERIQLPDLPYSIIYKLAANLGLRYWRVYETATNVLSDVTVTTRRLREVLERIDTGVNLDNVIQD